MFVPNPQGKKDFIASVIVPLERLTQYGVNEANYYVPVDTGDLQSTARASEVDVTEDTISQDVISGGIPGPAYNRIVDWAEWNNDANGGYFDLTLEAMAAAGLI
jgi:hypothetical protein